MYSYNESFLLDNCCSQVTSAYSKNWSCREKAFASLFEVLSALPESTSKDYMRRQLQDAAILIIKGLKGILLLLADWILFLTSPLLLDNVLAVNMAALRLLEMILVNFIPRHKLGRVDVTNVVAQILPTLIQKTGDAVSIVYRCSGKVQNAPYFDLAIAFCFKKIAIMRCFSLVQRFSTFHGLWPLCSDF